MDATISGGDGGALCTTADGGMINALDVVGNGDSADGDDIEDVVLLWFRIISIHRYK